MADGLVVGERLYSVDARMAINESTCDVQLTDWGQRAQQ